MTEPKPSEALSSGQVEMLAYLSKVPGCDVWDRHYAHVCRDLEPLKLVRIVKAKNPPKEGWQQQPFFGAKITAAGRAALLKATARTTGQEVGLPELPSADAGPFPRSPDTQHFDGKE